MDYSRFFEIYNNVPDKARREVIVVVNEKPYSWDAVNVELNAKTDLGKVMYEKLVKMEII